MGKLKNNQSGFSAVEAVLVLVIVGLVGFVGWYVYHTKNITDKTLAQTTKETAPPAKTKSINNLKSFTDSTKLYSFRYLNTWSTNEFKVGVDTDIALASPSEVSVTPANAPDVTSAGNKNFVLVLAFKSSDTKTVLSNYATGDKQSTIQNLTINGNPAMYQQSSATGANGEAPTYTQDTYAITHNGTTLLLSFRVKQSADTTSTSTAFDATSSVPEFTALAKSVKFVTQ